MKAMETNDVWADLGYSKQTPRGEAAVARIPFSPKQKLVHESEEETALRRARGWESIFAVFPDAKLEASGRIEAVWGEKKFDFYPASDCWYVYSTGQYGRGIEKLCAQILRMKLKEEQP